MMIIELFNEFLKLNYNSIPKKEERIYHLQINNKTLKINDCEDKWKFFSDFPRLVRFGQISFNPFHAIDFFQCAYYKNIGIK